MIKNAVVFDAAVPAGYRVTKDLLKKGCQVFAAVSEGEKDVLNSLMNEYPSLSVIEINPLSDDSVMKAVHFVEEKIEALEMIVVLCDKTPEGSRKQIADGINYQTILDTIQYNALAPVRLINSFLPLLDKGEAKRICVMTSRLSSNNLCEDVSNYAVRMAGASLNMAVKTLFNRLRPDWYTFRLFCYNRDAEGEKQGDFAAEYFTRNRSNDPEEQNHSDENFLVMRDWRGRDVPW